jgi:hypothetical protein
MISRVNKNVKCLIFNILNINSFSELSKPRKDFIECVLWHILSIKGKTNFLQFGRFSHISEQTYRNYFEKEFDFMDFNMQLINQVASGERVVALARAISPKQASPLMAGANTGRGLPRQPNGAWTSVGLPWSIS